MKIGILTYDVPHKRTQDVTLGLINKSKYKIKLYTTPFKPRKKREVIFSHRPFQIEGPSPSLLAEKFGLAIGKFSNIHQDSGIDYVIVTGSGLIDESLIKGRRLINCHSGLTPLVRGLDSLKWAIYKGLPVGNTLHFIDAGIDSGEIISQRELPIYKNDDFLSIAERLYKDEIDYYVNFEHHLGDRVTLNLDSDEPARRMPKSLEKEMGERIQGWVNTYSKNFVELKLKNNSTIYDNVK